VNQQNEAQAASQSICNGLVDEASTRTRLLAWLGVLLPIGIFWATCIRYLSPLPVADDYDAVLLFLVHLRHMPTRGAQIAAIIFEQHNEYKLVWLNVVTALQYRLSGHVNFIVLSLLGDLQIMLLAWLLWKSFVRESVRGTCRLALFVPVALILFQTNYAETLDWPMGALQNLGVVTFALLSLWLINQPGTGAFAGACVGLTLAIAASGNGFFLYPVGLLFLWQQRRFKLMAIWTLTTVACAALYFNHYTRFAPGPGNASHPGLHPVFILSFLGSFAGVSLPVIRFASVPAGACVLAGIFIAARRGYHRRNPSIAGFILFLLITALAVSLTRGGLGYVQSLSSRYKIYSDLLLICLYAVGIDFMQGQTAPRRHRAYTWSVAIASVLFLVGTAYGIRSLRTRFQQLNQGLAIYQKSHGMDGPVPLPAHGTADERDGVAAFNVHFRNSLNEAAAANVYHLP